jgi:hypothetical protein
VDVGGDRGNFAAGDRHIHDGVDPVLRIDDVTVSDEKNEFLLLSVQRDAAVEAVTNRQRKRRTISYQLSVFSAFAASRDSQLITEN